MSCSCVLILGIRNSEYFYNHEQIAVFVPCNDGGSEILNLSKKESAMGARSLSHEIAQFNGIGKLDVLFLFFLLLISENISEPQTFSASNTSSLLNFPKLESQILVWKAFLTSQASSSSSSIFI